MTIKINEERLIENAKIIAHCRDIRVRDAISELIVDEIVKSFFECTQLELILEGEKSRQTSGMAKLAKGCPVAGRGKLK